MSQDFFERLYAKTRERTPENPQETQFIQKGVETLINKAVYLIKKYTRAKIPLSKTADSIKSELNPPSNNTFSDNTNILKVGSFYDGTKNNFPDEFDFIFLLETIREVYGDVEKYRYLSISEAFLDEMVNILETRELVKHLEYSENDSSSERVIRFEKVVRIRGPGVKLKFIYEEWQRRQAIGFEFVHADLTPAIKIVTEDLSLYIDDLCVLNQFANEIVDDKAYLVLKNGLITFTETEKRFMQGVLSENHRRVFRTLKYLINGIEGEGEKLEESNISNRPSFSISSYQIKCAMIQHHYECKDVTTEPDCLLELVKTLSKCHQTNEWVHVSWSNHRKRERDHDFVDTDIRRKGVEALDKIRLQLECNENSEIVPVAQYILNYLRKLRFIVNGSTPFMKNAFFKDPDISMA